MSDKFKYLSESEPKDSWYRGENKLFVPLRNAINCINGLNCARPAFRPYVEEKSHAVHFTIEVEDESVMWFAFRILTRALDRRYNGVTEWVCKLEHTDTRNLYIIWLDSGMNTRNNELIDVVEDSNRIASNIMAVLDNEHTLTFFNSGLTSDRDFGHTNSEQFEKIAKKMERAKKLKKVLD